MMVLWEGIEAISESVAGKEQEISRLKVGCSQVIASEVKSMFVVVLD